MNPFRTVRTSQPQQPVGVDWSNPITRGLVALIDIAGAGTQIALPGIETYRRGGGSFLPRTAGVAFTGPGTTPQGLGIRRVRAATSNFSALIPAGSPFTLAIGVVPFATGAREFIFSDFVSGGSSQSIGIEQTTGNVFRFQNGGQVDTGTVVAGAFTNLAFVRSGDLTPFVNGRAGSSVALGTPGTGQELVLGAPGAFTGGLNFRGGIYYCYIWNRALTLAEIRLLNTNPWQLFSSDPFIDHIQLGGSGLNYTLSAGGSFSLSGIATFLREKVLSAVGSFNLSGTALFLKERTLSSSGTITFSGTAPFSSSGETTLNAGGTVNFSGQASLLKTKVLSAGGTINFSGGAPLIFIPAGGSVATEAPRNIAMGLGNKGRIS